MNTKHKQDEQQLYLQIKDLNNELQSVSTNDTTKIEKLQKEIDAKQDQIDKLEGDIQSYNARKHTLLAQVVSTIVPTAQAAQNSPTNGWAALRQCESGGNYAINTGNGYYGAYQFNLGTWANYGGYARPDLAPPAVQDAAALELYGRRGSAPWPVCGRFL